VLLASVIVAPIAALTMLGSSALRPSSPAEHVAPSGETVVDRAIASPATIRGPDTTLVVAIDGPDVTVVAGDGGGAGRLPRAWAEPVHDVRVVRDSGGLYAIEIAAGERTFHSLVDGAGVRFDDSIRRRLEEHVPTWALLVILAAFAACGLMCVRALAPLGSLRAAPGAIAEDRRRARADAQRIALGWGLALLPFALGALAAGLVSLS
jgi:hypothetical protein